MARSGNVCVVKVGFAVSSSKGGGWWSVAVDDTNSDTRISFGELVFRVW